MDERAAVAPPPDTRLRDKVRGTSQRRARQSADTLVERDVDAVEERRDLRVRAVVERRGLPQARAVHMREGMLGARPGRLLRQLLPGRKLAAEVALRQF